jgi:enamine deaminase RidA (YjgF/YER057c/UK114 family)
VFDTLETVSAEVDCDLSAVSKATTYLVNIDRDATGYSNVWHERFDEPYPCHRLLGIKKIVVNGFLVEIDLEAII